MKRETTESIIWGICIVILIILTIKIQIDSTEYDCDKCIVSLSNAQAYGGFYKAYEEPIIKLIEAYKDGTCLYTWDPTQGYVKNG